MQLTVESIRDQIPFYLTKEQQEGLVKALADFPAGMNYYTNKHETDLLQGDCWTSLHLFRFETGERKAVRGIILSNSCDVAPENQRDTPVRLLFAPIISLNAFVSLLEKNGLKAASIESKVKAIREQKITSIFFLPRGGALSTDYIAILDDVHAMPSESFFKTGDKAKLATLSLPGFYMFLLKLSVHFCRFHENVVRD